MTKSLMENFNFCAALSYTHDTHAVKNVYYTKTTEDLETAAACIRSSKKVFLKILQITQESTCIGVSL